VSDWRIDELAQRAGIAVDTIRYYQREGLLPTGERAGRTRRYEPQHLERLERIRALQSRRFSLAAIRALLDREVPGALEGLLAGPDGATYDFEDLVESSGVSPEFADVLAEAGLLREPGEHGHTDYDSDDLNMLRAFADLQRLQVPEAVLAALGRVYADGIDAIQHRVAAVLAGTEGPGWTDADYARFHESVGDDTPRIAHDMRVITDYTQQRSLQRLVLHKLELRSAAHKLGLAQAADVDDEEIVDEN
jgi:DNA-binding transcriptional MerR regulator